MSNLKPIVAKVSIWIEGHENANTSVWDYELLKEHFMGSLDLKIGKILNSREGDNFEITDIQLNILGKENDNIHGVDFSQHGETGTNNIIVKVLVKDVVII